MTVCTGGRMRCFELCDAVLCADGPVCSLVGLSLAAEHRRGHGALYDAVNAGRIQVDRLRRQLAGLPLPRDSEGRIVLAVDVSAWLRPGAATAPDRSFCHVYGRGKSAAQLIPGWPYSFVADGVVAGGSPLYLGHRGHDRRGTWATGPANKIVVGLPFYGNQYIRTGMKDHWLYGPFDNKGPTPNSLAFDEKPQPSYHDLVGGGGWSRPPGRATRYWDTPAGEPCLFNPAQAHNLYTSFNRTARAPRRGARQYRRL
jgi:hypothetical protein